MLSFSAMFHIPFNYRLTSRRILRTSDQMYPGYTFSINNGRKDFYYMRKTYIFKTTLMKVNVEFMLHKILLPTLSTDLKLDDLEY